MSSKGFKFQNDLFLIHNCRLSYTQCGPMTCIHWWTDAEIRLVQNVTDWKWWKKIRQKLFMNLSKSSNCGSKQNFMHKTGWCTKLSSLQRGYLNQVINFERHGNNDMTNTATH